MTIAVVYDRADAERFVAERPPAAHAVLPLTPAAASIARTGDCPLLDPRGRFTDGHQARTVARVRRARRRLFEALAQDSGWTVAAGELLHDTFEQIAPSALRLWHSLGTTGPWLIPMPEQWREVDDRSPAFALLCTHILAPRAAAQVSAAGIERPSLARLYRLLRRPLLGLLGARRNFVIGARKSQFNLLELLAAEPGRLRPVLIEGSRRGWRSHARLARGYLALLKPNAMIALDLVASPAADWRPRVEQALAALDDGIIREALGRYGEALALRIARMEAERRDAEAVLRLLKPERFTSSEISRPIEWLLAEVCGARGVPRLVMGRNGQIPGSDSISAEPARSYFLARYPTALTDEYLVWSPHGLAAARRFVPPAKQAGIHPFRGVPVVTRQAAPSRAGRRVLFADSFGMWWSKNIWFLQTSDEFVDGLRRLAHALADLPATELIVRLKHKTECDLEAIAALVDPPANCSLKVRDIPFERDIAEADLLVSFYSSVVQEAIHARRPVLLFGGTARCLYLPARETPPTGTDRAALYACRDSSSVGAMVAAILDAHAGRPLDDAEIAPHVFPSDVPDVKAFARAFAAGEPERLWAGTALPRRTAQPA
ncbi:MAG: hypothetical protein AB7P52_08720 [Alphaproteobacteria bacterium]